MTRRGAAVVAIAITATGAMISNAPGAGGAATHGLVLHVDAGIGPARIGETRRAVTRDLGPGRSRAPAGPPLNSCSFGSCRAYRVGGATLDVNYNSRTSRVILVSTMSPALTVEGHRPADGFNATRRVLKGWRQLRCSGSDILIHRRGRTGPTSTLSFMNGRFVRAEVMRGAAFFACVPRG
jgi:hypothetical protein